MRTGELTTSHRKDHCCVKPENYAAVDQLNRSGHWAGCPGGGILPQKKAPCNRLQVPAAAPSIKGIVGKRYKLKSVQHMNTYNNCKPIASLRGSRLAAVNSERQNVEGRCVATTEKGSQPDID